MKRQYLGKYDRIVIDQQLMFDNLVRGAITDVN
jgi:hypothetical protein